METGCQIHKEEKGVEHKKATEIRWKAVLKKEDRKPLNEDVWVLDPLVGGRWSDEGVER